MVKIAKTLLLILFTCSLAFGAQNYTKELQIADKKIATSSKDELLRLYHGLKNIYIHSIVTNDVKLKKDVLQRLVKTSKILNLDYKDYQKELATLTKPPSKLKVQKKFPPKVTTHTHRKTQTIKKNTASKNSRFVKKIIQNKDYLYLEFDDALSASDIKNFELKSKKERKEVFDIKAALLKKYSLKHPRGIQKVRIAQFNKKTVRIVIYRDDKKKSSRNIWKNTLKIYYNTSSSSKKQIVTPKLYTKISANKKIVIDAGHGGKDSGAIGYKRRYEKRAVLSIALKLGRELQKRGYKVYFTRTKDHFVRLRNRTRYANEKDADIFISIHANAAPHKSQYLSAKGIETYFLSPARSKRSKNVAALENKSDIKEMDYFSKQTFLNVFNREKIIAANKLALDIQQGMLSYLRSKHYKVVDGGVREAPFWVLVGAQMPAILIEVGYITNPTEAIRMFNVSYQKKLVTGIANGIDNYFVKNH